MLEKYFDLSKIKIRTGKDIEVYPKIDDRKSWESLSGDIKESLVREAEEYINYNYPALLAMNYEKLYSEDSRDPYMKPYNHRREVLTKLVIAECIENKGRFLADIVNGIYLVCEETTWMDPAHSLVNYAVNDGERDILPNKKSEMLDLSLGHTALVMAWTYYLLKDRLDEITPLISQNIEVTMDEKVFTPYLKRDDIWWFTFGNNWNTFMNNCIARAASIVLTDEKKLRKVLEKSLWSIDCYFKAYPYDGGCEEGTHYWHSNIGDSFLEWIKYVTFDKVDIFKEQQLKNIADYERNMYVGKNNYVSVSDSHMHFEKEKTETLFKIGKLVGNENLKIMAAKRGIEDVQNITFIADILNSLFYNNLSKEISKLENKEVSFEKSVWYDSIETAIWREKETEGGLFFTIKGGNNEELHNHNDVGNFAVFNDCEPVIIDAGMGVYSNTAFSPLRYTIWFFNSQYHNVPYIGGIEQKNEDKECKAINVIHTENSVSMDLAPAYRDDSILQWTRRVKYDRENNEFIFDEHYEFTDEKEIDLHFMLAEDVTVESDRIILPHNMELCYTNMDASIDAVSNSDKIMEKNWGKIYRLKLRTSGKCGDIHYTIAKRK